MKARHLCGVGLLLLLGHASPALAGVGEDFQAHFDKGMDLREHGESKKALQELWAAYRVKDDPRLLIIMGNLNLKVNNPKAALSLCHKYPKGGDPAAVTKAAECVSEAQKQLKAKPARVKEPATATEPPTEVATHTPEPQQPQPPQTQPSEPLKLAPVKPASQVALFPQNHQEHAQKDVDQPVTHVAQDRKPVYKRWWFWTALGAGAVAAVAIPLAVVYGSQGGDPLDGVAPGSRRQVGF